MPEYNGTEISIEIDGEPLEFTGFLDDPLIGTGPLGCFFGMNGIAKKSDAVFSHTPTNSIAILAVYGTKKNGDYWSINGLYKKGVWDKTEKDGILFSVEDRII